MSKQKRRKGQQKARPSARFAVGALVRVRPGTKDPDFTDIPLGGWSGTITEVEAKVNPPTYLIAWNQHTLDHMSPIYRKRCERDGLELESMWLGEDDLDPDDGGPVTIEQPTRIHTRALDMKDQDDRVRAVLGLTSDDPLPDVDTDTLGTYAAYLATRLSFPFDARYTRETGPMHDTTYAITVVGLFDADDCDEFYGLLCEARQGRRHLEVPLGEVEVTKKGDPNRQLIEDYSYWFCNWR